MTQQCCAILHIYIIQALTGITRQVLADNGALPFDKTWTAFTKWLQKFTTDGDGNSNGKQVVMLAHNAAFDLKFIKVSCERAGFGSNALNKAGIVCAIDTLTVLRDSSLWQESDSVGTATATASASRTTPYRQNRHSSSNDNIMAKPSSFKLIEVYKHLHGGVLHDKAHNAMGDIAALNSIINHKLIKDKWLKVCSNGNAQIPV
jgi:hypothetical protein